MLITNSRTQFKTTRTHIISEVREFPEPLDPQELVSSYNIPRDIYNELFEFLHFRCLIRYCIFPTSILSLEKRIIWNQREALREGSYKRWPTTRQKRRGFFWSLQNSALFCIDSISSSLMNINSAYRNIFQNMRLHCLLFFSFAGANWLVFNARKTVLTGLIIVISKGLIWTIDNVLLWCTLIVGLLGWVCSRLIFNMTTWVMQLRNLELVGE